MVRRETQFGGGNRRRRSTRCGSRRRSRRCRRRPAYSCHDHEKKQILRSEQAPGACLKLTLAERHLTLPVASGVTCYDRVAQHVEAGQAGIESFGAERGAVLGQGQQSVLQHWRWWAENGFAAGRRTVPSLIHITRQVRASDDDEALLTAVLHSTQVGASPVNQSSESVRD